MTQFFLDKKWANIIKNSHMNVMGTEGKMVQAYAKLISEIYYGTSKSVRPDTFKRILG